MFSAKDSLCCLRLARQKRSICEGADSSEVLPVDELRNLAKKRQRVECPAAVQQAPRLSPTSPSSNFSCSEVSQQRRGKSVQFDLTRNTFQERVEFSEDEISACWLSSAESQRMKTELRLLIVAIQQGLIDKEGEYIRGLEAHADPALTERKAKKNRAFIARILQQQTFLKSMMGKANEQIIAKLSAVLSTDDVRESALQAEEDANEAMVIHGRTVGKFPEAALTEPILSKTATTAAAPRIASAFSSSRDSAIMALLRKKAGNVSVAATKHISGRNPAPNLDLVAVASGNPRL